MILDKNSNVLVCDDDERIVSQVVKALDIIGIKNVITCFNYREAKNIIDQGSSLQLAIIDLRMPENGGTNLILHIKNNRNSTISSIPILPLVGSPTRREMHFIKDLEIYYTLKKPFLDGQLVDLLLRVLNSQEVSSSHYISDAMDNDQLVRMVSNSINKPGFDLNNALSVVEQKLETNAKSPRLFTVKAEVLHRMGNGKAALELLKKVIAANPDYLKALNLYAKIAVTQGQYEDAIEAMEAAYSLSPLNTQRLLAMAEIHLGYNRLSAAEEKFRRALATNPDLERAKIGLARTLIERGSSEGKRMLSELSDPNIVVSELNLRGVILAKNKRYQDAIDLYQQAIQCAISVDQEKLLYYNISLAQFKNCKYDDATKSLKKVLSIDSKFPKAVQLVNKIQNKDYTIEEGSQEDSLPCFTQNQISFLQGVASPTYYSTENNISESEEEKLSDETEDTTPTLNWKKDVRKNYNRTVTEKQSSFIYGSSKKTPILSK